MTPDGTNAESKPASPATRTGEDALAWAVSSGSAEALVQDLRARARRRRSRRVVMSAAALVLVAVGLFALRPTPTQSLTPTPTVASAAVSSPVRRTLEDGSVVELARGAEISVEFSAGVRRVTLRQGEAHFAVAHDTSRPFIVVAGQLEVRAVGTAFLVGHVDRQIDVLVTEGRVAVDKPASAAVNATPAAIAPTRTPAASERTLALLDAGHQALFTGDAAERGAPQVVAVSASQQAARLAWRVPRLEFSATPLREVVAMFNRHGATRFTLDPALDDLRLSGVLRADDIDSLLLVLKNEFNIASSAQSTGAIALRRP